VERELRDTLPGGKFKNVSPKRRRTMQAIKSSNNRTTERRLRSALASAGLRGWQVRPPVMVENPDFVFERERVAIYVDGCYWHGCRRCNRLPKTNSKFWLLKIDRNRAKDSRANRSLSKKGWLVLRFWEHDLASHLSRCVERIERELNNR